MFDTEKAKMIAVKLARWHKVQPLADSDPNNHEDTKLWSTMRKWMNSGEKSLNVLGIFYMAWRTDYIVVDSTCKL